MKYLALLLLLVSMPALDAAAQPLPGGAGLGVNPLVDPFAVSTKVALPPVPPAPAKLPPIPPPPPAPVTPVAKQPLPAGLRAILIRDNGLGLLATAQAGAVSIPVSHGKPVRIAEQEYLAEVTLTAIRLYSAPGSKLAWEGSLMGSAAVTMPVDLSQVKFIPPLSAGVNPGLSSHSSLAGISSQSIAKVSEVQ